MCLEIALEFRFGTRRPDHDLDRFASDQHRIGGWQFVHCHRPDRPLRWAGRQASWAGVARSRAMAAVMILGSCDAYRHLIGLIDPVAACDLVQPVRDAPSLRFEAGSEGQHQDQRGYPVLVRNRFRIDAVANRLLIAVRQARHPSDPLEPGQGVDERLAVRGSDDREQGAGDDRTGVGTADAAPQRVLAKQHTELVAAQHPPLSIDDRGNRTAVGIRVVRDHQVGADLLRLCQSQVDGAGFLWIREWHCRKPRIRVGLLGNHMGRRKPASLDRPFRPASRPRRAVGCRPSAVRAAHLGYQGRDPIQIGGHQLLSEDCVGLGARHVVQAVLGDLLDPCGDLHVGGRHDLRAVAEIDLVAVVLRRIVRCGDHDAGHTAQVADPECHHGCRQWP